jgi:hypothetical protein
VWGPQLVGVRRLWSLLDGLPPDGKLGRKLRGDSWGAQSSEYLLALLVEQVDALCRVTLRANGVKKHLEPLHIPRPGEVEMSKPVKFGEVLRRVKEAPDGEGG